MSIVQDFKYIKLIVDWVELTWKKPTGLILSIILTILVGDQILEVFKLPFTSHIIILIVFLLVVVAIWCESYFPRKTGRGKIGFIISLYCSDEEENKKIREDFIDRIKIQSKKGRVGQIFQFIELPMRLAKNIESFEDANKIRIKYKAIFILYGRVRARPLGKHQYHFIDLDGIVSHRSVSKPVQNKLIKEFIELLPSEIRIKQESDILAFNFTSDFIEIVAKYIIGIAALISGDLNLAELLFSEVNLEISNKNRKFPIYDKIFNRIPKRLSEVRLNRASMLYNEWKNTHNDNLIESIGVHLELINEKYRKNQVFGILYSIFLFLYDRDIDGSLNSLRSYCPRNEFTWQMNYSFLMAYAGDLPRVKTHIDLAQLYNPIPTTIADTEEFTKWILELEPKRFTLHYYLGFLNWLIKGDLELAIKDFALFVTQADKKLFRKEITYCKQRIALLEKRIK